MSVSQVGGKWAFNGVKQDHVIGESAFKLLFHDYDNRMNWIGSRQALYDTEKLVFRVFGETAGWSPINSNQGMFGSTPRDPGIWDVGHLRMLSDRDDRVRELTPMNRKLIEWMFSASASMGCVFEYVCIATLEHTVGISAGVVDHCIRQTAAYCRLMDQKYPKSNVIFSAMNECFAHNKIKVELHDVNQWAKRFYRWKKGDDTKVSFASPGDGYVAEQWPEGMIIVDEGGGDMFSYSAGNRAGAFKAAMIHPDRTPSNRKWWQVKDGHIATLRNKANGTPVGFTESMYYVDAEDVPRAEQWYRNRNGWTSELAQYIKFLDAALPKTDYFIVHHEPGAQCSIGWPRAETKLDRHLKERFGGEDVIVPPPKPTFLFERIINLAFEEILGRPIVEQEGLESFNKFMLDGGTEAEMRELILRGPEYAKKNS